MKIDVETLQEINPLANPVWAWGSASIANAIFTFTPKTRVVFENEQILRRGQFIIATNHTHKMDFLPLRAPLLYRGYEFVSWVKARAYKDPAMGTFLKYTGNVPISSRGYLIAADYWDLFGERPTEEEYRALRDHVDKSKPLPDGERYLALQNTPRRMLGLFFHPNTFTYQHAIQQLYYELMQIALRMTRQAIHRGAHVQIYPQGAVSSRLTRGYNGIIHASLALGLPIVPVGISGCREVFVNGGPRTGPGDIIVRFGEPYEIDRSTLPSDLRPFHPEDEARYRDLLRSHVDVVMDRLNDTLEPDYQRISEDFYDGKEGLDRFF
jgi:1-acyl-sn-glycerol-3-phosphate acyltransferase